MQSDVDPLVAGVDHIPLPSNTNRRHDSSATWTSSSGDIGIFSDNDEVDDRENFVDEYNRLAKKHGIRLLVKQDFDTCPETDPSVSQQRKSSWFRSLTRKFSGSSHGSSTRQVSGTKTIRKVSSRLSLSEIATHLLHPKTDSFKDEDLQTLVRLSGKSKFYLPLEYAPSSLVLPTCFRATAQYLVQHGTETRGIFRTLGSPKVVSAIYDHYCPAQKDADITDTTVCSPNLPSHFKASVHDVAAVFKKFLAGLPGGILGSLALFDAFVAIHSQLYADPELNRTKQSKLRARLIGLAIGTLKSHYRRELICAVFGLLSLIGRKAEMAPREDEAGRPLPTSDLMGYNALGYIIGPLLVGNLLDSYSMKLANPNDGLVLLPLSPPRPRRDRSGRQSKVADGPHPPPIEVDKFQVASSIAEMIVTHWREVVKHLKSLGALRAHKEATAADQSQLHMNRLRPSASDSMVIRQPAEWNRSRSPSVYDDSPLAQHSSSRGFPDTTGGHPQAAAVHEPLHVKRRRPKSARSTPNNRSVGMTPRPVLSPTVEEAGSPYRQETGESHPHMQPIDTRLASATQESDPDVTYGILLQTGSPQKPAISGTSSASSRQNKGLKRGFPRAKKPRAAKSFQRAERVRRDTPAPGLSLNSSRRAWEKAHTPAKTVLDEEEYDIQPDATVDDTAEIDKMEPAPGPNVSFEQEPELRKVSWGPPGAFPQTPAEEARDFSVVPDINPGAFPSTPKDEVPQVVDTEKATLSTLGYSLKSTFYEASDNLVRGVTSAASALVNVFNPPSSDRSGSASPTKIPGPHGSLRRNSRPSKHKRLKKRLSLPASAQSESGTPMPPREGASVSDQPVRPSTPDATVQSDRRNSEPPVVLVDDGSGSHDRTRAFCSGIQDITAAMESVTNELTVLHPELPGTETRPAEGHRLFRSLSRKPSGSYFRSNDGNQSSVISDATREQAHNAATDELNEKYQPTHTIDTAEPRPEGFPETPGDHADVKADQGTDRRGKYNQGVDDRPQGSVRRLSYIFKGMRRASTISTPFSSRSRRDSAQSRTSATPSLQLFRRASIPAHPQSPKQAPDFTILGPGRMTPYQEEPPVASHLSRKLPPRSATPSMETMPTSTTPNPGGSAAALYAQVLHLQRRLAARTEEIAHLSRQLEAVGEGEAGALSERLRAAEREVRMWKERALAAERRVVVFERFLERVRRLREKRRVSDGGGEEGIQEEIEREMMAIDGPGQYDGVPGEEESGELDSSIVMAAKEVLENDDMRQWLNGSLSVIALGQ